MRKNAAYRIVVCCLLLCGAASAGPAPRTLELGKGDNGKNVKAAVGDKMRLTLAGNPTTGYVWSVVKTSGDSVKFGKLKFKRAPTPGGIVGVGGKYSLVMTVVKTGGFSITLHYQRPWLKGKQPPAGKFNLNVNGGAAESKPAGKSVVATGAKMVKLSTGHRFTEGPAVDPKGNVFFTDIPKNTIHKWSVDGKVSLWRKDSGGANGLFFDKKGNLLACEGNRGRVTSITPKGKVTVLADKYGGKRFNRPNDLWIDPAGGVYFTDPVYGSAKLVQDGYHVYYLSPDGKKITRVINDLNKPNGIIGTPDGKILYVADHGAGKIYRYDIGRGAAVSGKKEFAAVACDGMTLDSEGNIYLTEVAVLVFNSAGKRIERIDVPERPSNVCFGGADRKTLFVTARSSLYSIPMRVKGVR